MADARYGQRGSKLARSDAPNQDGRHAEWWIGTEYLTNSSGVKAIAAPAGFSTIEAMYPVAQTLGAGATISPVTTAWGAATVTVDFAGTATTTFNFSALVKR